MWNCAGTLPERKVEYRWEGEKGNGWWEDTSFKECLQVAERYPHPNERTAQGKRPCLHNIGGKIQQKFTGYRTDAIISFVFRSRRAMSPPMINLISNFPQSPNVL